MADRSPSTMLISAGKSTTIVPTSAIAILVWPKISRISGAIATSGTDRSNIAIGMNANSNGSNSTNSDAITSATSMPMTKPSPASVSVVSRPCSASDRAWRRAHALRSHAQLRDAR